MRCIRFVKSETDLSPVTPGPLEDGEGALLHEEPSELAGVERRLLLRQLRRDPLAPLRRRPPPDGVQRPRAVLGTRKRRQLPLKGGRREIPIGDVDFI